MTDRGERSVLRDGVLGPVSKRFGGALFAGTLTEQPIAEGSLRETLGEEHGAVGLLDDVEVQRVVHQPREQSLLGHAEQQHPTIRRTPFYRPVDVPGIVDSYRRVVQFVIGSLLCEEPLARQAIGRCLDDVEEFDLGARDGLKRRRDPRAQLRARSAGSRQRDPRR